MPPAVLESDFYRAGERQRRLVQKVEVILSDDDPAGDSDGVRNVSIEKVGCGSADIHFNS